MCGRYMVTKPPDSIRRLFGTQGALPNFPPRYNVAPTQAVPVIARNKESHRALVMMRWGLVPWWIETAPDGKPQSSKPLINARAETVADMPAFRDSLHERRCLIPADGYFEWDQRTEARTPHLFRAPDQGLFAFAGLWDRWRAKGSDRARPPLLSCTVITSKASPLVAPLHDRMPVILPQSAWSAWLGESKQEEQRLLDLLQPGGDEGFTDTVVSTRVNSHRNDDDKVIDPSWAETAATPRAKNAAHEAAAESGSGRLL